MQSRVRENRPVRLMVVTPGVGPLIYLDNNATTQPLPEVLEEVTRVSRDAFGNPGSRHMAGRKARQVLETSREVLAQILDAQPSEILFTSGGTESINLALFGLMAGRNGTIVTLPGEHPATAESLQRLSKSVHHLPLDISGRLRPEGLDEVDWGHVSLVTALLAHNETGVIQEMGPLAKRCQESGIPWHIDAVQAVGKTEVSFRKLQATALSLAAHKFHGPRGIGALILRSGTPLRPCLFGGHQERDLRPGTEPVALAAGMALALKLWEQHKSDRTSLMQSLRNRLEQGLTQQCAPVVVNGANAERLPNTSSISFPGCEADALLIALDLEGLCCSHGSACSSGSTEPSPILGAMGLPVEVQRSTLRFSVSCQTSLQDVDEAISRIARVVSRLRNHPRSSRST